MQALHVDLDNIKSSARRITSGSFRRQFWLAGCALVVVCVLSITLSAVATYRQAISHNTDDAEHVVEQLAEEITEDLEATRNLLSVVYGDVLNKSIENASCNALSAKAQKVSRFFDHVTDVKIIENATGQVICHDRSPAVNLSEPLDLEKFEIAVPVDNLGNIIATLSYAALFDDIEKAVLPEHAGIFVLDPMGRVKIARHDLGNAYWAQQSLYDTPFWHHVSATRSGTFVGEGADQKQRIIAFDSVKVGSTPYKLVVTMDTAQIVRDTFGGGIIYLSVAVFAFAATLIGLFFVFSRYVLSPVQELYQFTKSCAHKVDFFQANSSLSLRHDIDPKSKLDLQYVAAVVSNLVSVCIERALELEAIQERSGIATWWYDKYDDKIIGSSNFRSLLGVDADVDANHTMAVSDFIFQFHAEDQAEMAHVFSFATTAKTPGDIVCRRLVNGEERFFRLTVSWVSLGDGQKLMGLIIDVTGPQKLERELSQKNAFFNAVLDSLNDAVVACNEKGEVVYFNRAAVELHGELPGKGQETHTLSEYYSLFSADGTRLLEDDEVPLMRALNGEKIQHDEIVIAPVNLPARHVIVRGQPVYDEEGTCMGGVVAQTDTTDIRKMSMEIGEKERGYRQILEALNTGFLILDGDSQVVFRSKYYLAHFARAEEYLIANVAAAKNNLDSRASKGHGFVVSFETEVDLNGSKGLPVEILVYKIEFNGKLNTLVKVLDITHRRESQKKIVEVQKLEAIGRLSAGVAHDFNNIFQIILMNLDLLEDDLSDDPDNVELVSACLSAATKGSELSKRLTAFSKQQELENETLNIAEYIQKSHDLYQNLAGKDVVVRILANDHVPDVSLDRVQFDISMSNLIANARGALPDGGTIDITIGTIDVEHDMNWQTGPDTVTKYCVVSVQDDGLGMEDYVRQRAVDPFYTTKNVGEGSGLGLSVVYGFMQQSKGHMEIESQVGHGTTISLYFPAKS